MICTCPAATALTDITAVTCPENFGQIQKIAFQRLVASGVKNKFTTTNPIDTLASWTTLKAAADSTKVVISPYINAPTVEAGEARTFGGGNDTLGGIEEILGANPTSFSAVLRKMPAATIRDLKKLMCEADAGNLGVYLFDENGMIGAIQDGSTPTTYYPIPVRSLFVGDKSLGGFEAPDTNTISWSFLPDWSDYLAKVAPTDFNPLTDL
jgi:hypothetical protein